MIIEDGTGTGSRAEVDKANHLVVKAITEREIEHESQERGAAYNWSSDIVSVDAADTVLLIKNTSDKNLHIERIHISNGSTASEYTVHTPTTEVTPAGGAVVGTNLNTGSSNVADADAKSDETNNSQGNVIFTRWLAVDRNTTIETNGLILAKNKSIAVDVVEIVTETAVTIKGFYES